MVTITAGAPTGYGMGDGCVCFQKLNNNDNDAALEGVKTKKAKDLVRDASHCSNS